MAAVTKVNPSLVTPVTEARIRRGKATADITKGSPVTVDGAATPGGLFETAYKLATAEANAIGLALKDAKSGAVVEVLIDGEMGGFSGLPKGNYLSVATGSLDTTAPAVAGVSRFYAYSDTVVMVL